MRGGSIRQGHSGQRRTAGQGKQASGEAPPVDGLNVPYEVNEVFG